MDIVQADRIDRHIYIIRGQRVMLDRDLADKSAFAREIGTIGTTGLAFREFSM